MHMSMPSVSKLGWKKVNFPKKTRFIRHIDRVYISTDFEDEEPLELYDECDRPLNNALGYRWYVGIHSRVPKMIKYDEIEWA